MSRVDLINWDESCECKHSYPPFLNLQFGCKHVPVGPKRLRLRKAELQCRTKCLWLPVWQLVFKD